MRYSAAGHPPLMLAPHGAAQVREIEENGLMLGLFPEAEYSSVEIKIGRGDRCLLYTDGVFEASNAAREEFAENHAAGNFWKHSANCPLQSLPASFLIASQLFPGTTPVVRRKMTSHPAGHRLLKMGDDAFWKLCGQWNAFSFQPICNRGEQAVHHERGHRRRLVRSWWRAKKTYAWMASMTKPKITTPYAPPRATGLVFFRYRYIR